MFAIKLIHQINIESATSQFNYQKLPSVRCPRRNSAHDRCLWGLKVEIRLHKFRWNYPTTICKMIIATKNDNDSVEHRCSKKTISGSFTHILPWNLIFPHWKQKFSRRKHTFWIAKIVISFSTPWSPSPTRPSDDTIWFRSMQWKKYLQCNFQLLFASNVIPFFVAFIRVACAAWIPA